MNWKKIRVQYCTIKVLIGGAKSVDEITYQISFFQEFYPLKKLDWQTNELTSLVSNIILELKSRGILRNRDIYNTITNARRIEWFISPDWIAKTRNFRTEKRRVKDLELAARRAKEEEEKRRIAAEEKERIALQEKERLARENGERIEREKRNREKESNQIESVFKNILIILSAIGAFVIFLYGLKLVLDIIAAIGRAIGAILFNPITIGIAVVVFVIYLFRKS